jgi:hypothetical protein
MRWGDLTEEKQETEQKVTEKVTASPELAAKEEKGTAETFVVENAEKPTTPIAEGDEDWLNWS